MAIAKPQPAKREAEGPITWREPKLKKRISRDETLAEKPEFEKLIMADKIRKFRDPKNLGNYAGFPFVVCSFATERAESGHNSAREADESAREKWGEDYHRHGVVVKVKARRQIEEPTRGNSR